MLETAWLWFYLSLIVPNGKQLMKPFWLYYHSPGPDHSGLHIEEQFAGILNWSQIGTLYSFSHFTCLQELSFLFMVSLSFLIEWEWSSHPTPQGCYHPKKPGGPVWSLQLSSRFDTKMSSPHALDVQCGRWPGDHSLLGVPCLRDQFTVDGAMVWKP